MLEHCKILFFSKSGSVSSYIRAFKSAGSRGGEQEKSNCFLSILDPLSFMKIKDIGGEFALIRKLTQDIPPEKVVVGIGDDCAVLEGDDEHYLLVTTDMLVEKDHFRRDWYSPYQIGKKAMEANVSDIAAMGGWVETAYIAISLTNDIDVEFMEEFYRGMKEVCEKFDFIIAGGDTTHGGLLVITITLMGKVRKEQLCLRGHARPGDLICVSGDLGKSWAGLELLLKGIEPETEGLQQAVKDHLNPSCRMDIAAELAPHVNAMIDVSDGLASEVNHICDESGTGARVDKGKILLSPSTMEAGVALGKDPYWWALNGGEDFELVFTIPEEKFKQIEHLKPVVVGRILEEKKGRWLVEDDGTRKPLVGGYDHFG